MPLAVLPSHQSLTQKHKTRPRTYQNALVKVGPQQIRDGNGPQRLDNQREVNVVEGSETGQRQRRSDEDNARVGSHGRIMPA
jgi:hypothetical protein